MNFNRDKDRLQMYISVTKIAIVLCWLSLFSFWALKIFGGNFFEIMVENENFLKFSQALQNTCLKYFISVLTMSASYYLMFCAVVQRFVPKRSQIIFFIVCIFTNWFIINFVNITFLKTIYGYLTIILAGVLFNKGYKRTFGFISFILDFVFSSISMITRNISLGHITNYLAVLILIIDMYIMTTLYYLYSNLSRIKKEK